MGGNVSSVPDSECIQSPQELVLNPFCLGSIFLFHHPSILPASSSVLSSSSPNWEPFSKALRLKSAEGSVSKCSALLLSWQKELAKID